MRDDTHIVYTHCVLQLNPYRKKSMKWLSFVDFHIDVWLIDVCVRLHDFCITKPFKIHITQYRIIFIRELYVLCLQSLVFFFVKKKCEIISSCLVVEWSFRYNFSTNKFGIFMYMFWAPLITRLSQIRFNDIECRASDWIVLRVAK